MDLLQRQEETVIYDAQGANMPISSKAESAEITSQKSQPAQFITNGLCINCDNLGNCVWQHNYKLNCQHYH
ncbi:MAG: hypothetical protein ITG00_01240 [Flavobacterium sp.]|nr:hypothetical protein [Flavobacterium sp.]